MKILSIVTLMLLASPAMAFELYHCTVNDVTDGYFNTLDLKVDGKDVSGSAAIQGSTAEIGQALSAETYDGDAKSIIEVVFRSGDQLESVAFSLTDVVSKLGPATRYSIKSISAADGSEKPVQMICDMAVPD